MASIYKRNNKLWIRYSVHGKEYREALGIDATRQGWIEARKIQKVKEGELAMGYYQGKIRAKLGLTLSSAFKEFLETKKDKSSATICNYKLAYQKLIDFCGDIRVNEIDTNLVEKFEYYLRNTPYKRGKKKEKKLKQISVATYFRGLRIAFKFFVEKNYIRINPFPNIKAPEKEIITIPQDELTKILEKLYLNNFEHYKVIMMFLMTGMRAGELTRLRFKDIDLKKNLLTISNTKGKRNDLFPIYPELRNFLLENFEFGEGKVFDYKNNNSLKFWKRFLKKNGFNHYTIHCLRKTFITMLVNDGINIFDVSKLARHKDIRTTMKSYAHADVERLGDLVNGSVKIRTLNRTKYKNALKMVK